MGRRKRVFPLPPPLLRRPRLDGLGLAVELAVVQIRVHNPLPADLADRSPAVVSAVLVSLEVPMIKKVKVKK